MVEAYRHRRRLSDQTKGVFMIPDLFGDSAVSSLARQQSNGFLTTRNAWIEGRTPRPSGFLSCYESNINILLGLFLGGDLSSLLCPERDAFQPVTIINKHSGKALEIEGASTNQFARTRQVTPNGEPNQRWFIERPKFSKPMAVPAAIFREAYRYWPGFLRFPFPGYSLIAAHSGLCLDLLNSLATDSDRLQQSPVSGRSSHLWGFVPDQQGYNFIVNLCSSRVLDVADSSLKNYAAVHQYPFNGGDSQRWQLIC
jgi:Ricin-type beta-trefoil lectin domain-like